MALKIERDARVVAADGAQLGRVKHVVVDDETKEVTDLVVEHGGHERLIPASAVASADGRSVRLRGGRAELEGVGIFNRANYHAVDDERAATQSERRALRGGAPLQDADDDAVLIEGVEQAPPATGFRYAQQPTSATPPPTRRDDGTETVELREEELRARKEMVEVGEIGVRKEIITEQQTLEVPVRREEVVIERHPVERRPSTRPIDEGQVIEIPVREEEVTIEKVPVVTEEITIGKRVMEENEQVSETVHREVVDIEAEGDVDVRGSGARPRDLPPEDPRQRPRRRP